VTVTDIWLYLLMSFFLGLGLGWWLFSSRSSPRRPPASADAARQRARSTPPPEPPTEVAPTPVEVAQTPQEPQPSAMQAIPSEVLVSLRQQLEQAREARKEAESLASHLDQQRRAALARESDARSRQETLAARLEKARGDRDHLRAEVEAARRTIHRMEEDASVELPTAHFEPEAAPDPPRGLRSSSPPDTDHETDLARTPPIPERTAPRTEGASVRVGARPPATRKKRPAPKSKGPVEVLFGPLSSVPVTPNTRSIPFELTARVKPDAPRETQIEGLHVYLRFDLEDEGVAINGRRRGPLTLYKGSALSRSRPIIVQLGVSTGFHSDTPEADRPPAVPGSHRIIIMVEYRVAGEAQQTSARFAAAIPVTARSS